jgi:phosphoribosylformimino-5-aminoimidazole carboxamide ribotide isomerase
MQIWPAIDLLDGKCVRLQQGDYSRDTVFSDDPAATARKWFDLGSRYLHCVDLDGAKSGSIVNESAIKSIVQAAEGRPVQLGGGVRNEETIKRLLGLGLSRLVVGTSALKDPEWFSAMCEKYKGHLVLGLDARDGMVATQGWLKTSHITATSLITQIQQMTDDVVAVVYTDIARDGMLSGPNLEALAALMQVSQFPVVASGGVTTLEDIDRLIAMDVPACIIGRSLYEGHLDLQQVLKRAGGRDAQTVS